MCLFSSKPYQLVRHRITVHWMREKQLNSVALSLSLLSFCYRLVSLLNIFWFFTCSLLLRIPISSRFRWINTHFLPVVDHILNLCSLFVACCICNFLCFFFLSRWVCCCFFFHSFEFDSGCRAFYLVLCTIFLFAFRPHHCTDEQRIIDEKMAIKMERIEEWILMFFRYISGEKSHTRISTEKKWDEIWRRDRQREREIDRDGMKENLMLIHKK